jgi:hypothetical protein
LLTRLLAKLIIYNKKKEVFGERLQIIKGQFILGLTFKQSALEGGKMKQRSGDHCRLRRCNRGPDDQR